MVGTHLRVGLCIVSLLLPGCVTGGAREAQVVTPDGKTYRVICQSDGRLDYKNGDLSISVDNRGRPGVIEQVLGATVIGVTGSAQLAAKEAIK